ncbi:hypothetical protein niasHS_018040 [Heterodera schachtii]|uniref:Ubiquitin-like domain-containing protein n=1 Tax=Heterodera schachtii TaxID=97005 RepID=A0ABD2HWZ9_HETSC
MRAKLMKPPMSTWTANSVQHNTTMGALKLDWTSRMPRLKPTMDLWMSRATKIPNNSMNKISFLLLFFLSLVDEHNRRIIPRRHHPNIRDEFEVTVEYVPNKHWNKYTISVKRTDTLATLKDKIREKYTADYNEYGFGTIELVKQFYTDEREPFVMRNDVELWHEDLDEYKTMEQCGIREGSMVSVFYARRLDKEEYDQGFYIRPWPTPKKIYF